MPRRPRCGPPRVEVRPGLIVDLGLDLPTVPDQPRKPKPPRRAADRSGRRPRFVLPDDHHAPDDRVSEHIEAFLEGPPRTRRSKAKQPPVDLRRPRRVIPLDTRADWNVALRSEEARVLRYGRPAAVLIVDIEPASPRQLDRIAQLVGAIVRREARETDRIARMGPGRFHVLLPETPEREAMALGERIRRACAEVTAVAATGGGTVRTAAAGPLAGQTLGDALRVAEARLAA